MQWSRWCVPRTAHSWASYEGALRDGFTPMPFDRRHLYHQAHVEDGVVLDAARPEFLIFTNTSGAMRLDGLMFLAAHLDEQGPQVGGPLTVWHRHVWGSPLCLLHGLVVVGAPRTATGPCEHGVRSTRSPEMLHLWLVETEEPAADAMTVPRETFASEMVPPATRERRRASVMHMHMHMHMHM